ncbi:MAG: thiopeptide-type bacteriocin biosynthesis protein [Bacteroidales bacterium]|nr:thiopeptide-type bacteriocin biosynthesis protein [Bacteroidales bacterium]
MKRSFITGSEWLFYKLYCGYGTGDELLREVVGPLSEMLEANGKINGWFFIRYADPEPHLRWRLHFDDLSQIGLVETLVEQALLPYVESRQINKVMTDTYKREIERYGEETMELCESLFGYDSAMIVQMLALIDQMPDKETYRWQFSMKAIDSLLCDFGYPLEARHDLSKVIADAFGREFGIAEATIQQFSDKYRQTKARIFKFMHEEDGQAKELYGLIKRKTENSEIAISRFRQLCPDQKRLDEIMHSLIHMTMNRIFIAQQRKHEVVLYGFLERYYRSEIAKEKYCKK